MKRLLLPLFAAGVVFCAGAALAQVNVSNYKEQGGSRTVIGGSLDVVSGGDLDMESGSTLKIAGTTVSGTAAELDEAHVVFRIQDISGANSGYAVAPATGTISQIYSVVDGATTGAITVLQLFANAVSGSPSNIDVASGASAGEIDEATPSALAITVGQLLEIRSDGASASNVDAIITVIIDR